MTMLDTLAMLIGFVTVMLVLSLVVSGITQAIQSWLKMRERNLIWGLSLLLDAFHTAQTASTFEGTPADKKKWVGNAKRVAKKVVAIERQPGDPGVIERLMSVGTPQVAAVSESELPRILKDAAISETIDLGKSLSDEMRVREQFTVAKNRMSDRFKYQIRILTFLLALGVAALFQISAPDLLTRLSTDPAYRNQLTHNAETIYAQTTELVRKIPTHEDVADQALTAVAEQFPEHADDIYQAAGVGFDRDSVVGELEHVLKELDNEKRDQIVIAYGREIDKLYNEQFEQAIGRIKATSAAAAQIDLRILPYGPEFYSDPINLTGLLITAILLSFGAPFWYDTLGMLIKIKKNIENPNKTNNKADSAPEKS